MESSSEQQSKITNPKEQNSEQQKQESIVSQEQQNAENVEQMFDAAKQSIISNDNGGNGHHNSHLPGIVGNELVNCSIRNIDKNLELNNINNKIDSFESFKNKEENKTIKDEKLLKHLYFNDVLSNVYTGFNTNNDGGIYFQTKEDYELFAKYLQAKTLDLVIKKNGNDLGNSGRTYGRYLNVQVADKGFINGSKDNSYYSRACIKNNTNYFQEYEDFSTQVRGPFVASMNCSFNATKGFTFSSCVQSKNTQTYELNKLGVKYEEAKKEYEEAKKEKSNKGWIIALVILSILCIALGILAGIFGYLYLKKKKEEEEEQKKAEEEKNAQPLDDHTNVKSTEDASIKYAQGTNVTRTGKDSNGNKTSVVTDVNDVKYGKDLNVNGQLKDATELAAAGETKNITAGGKTYNVLNIDVTKGTNGADDTYKLTLTDGTTKTFNQSDISSVKIGSKEYVDCLDTMENVDIQRSGNNTYFYYNTNDLEANLSTDNPTVTAYDANGVAMISTNATSEAGLSLLQQIYDDNPGCQYNARLNTLLGNDWYDKNGYLHDYKTGNLVEDYKNKQLTFYKDHTETVTKKDDNGKVMKDADGKEITEEQTIIDIDIKKDISDYYSSLTKRNSSDKTDYTATEKIGDFTEKYKENYANKIGNSNFDLYDDITTNNSTNTSATYSLNNTYKDRTNCLFA